MGGLEGLGGERKTTWTPESEMPLDGTPREVSTVLRRTEDARAMTPASVMALYPSSSVSSQSFRSNPCPELVVAPIIFVVSPRLHYRLRTLCPAAY